VVGAVKLSAMSDDEVMWSMTCAACDHEWMQTTPEGSDPQKEEVECPECGSTLLEADYAGRT
jgi:DNA-directed RNA polymerase subunit RPC12/RpoP